MTEPSPETTQPDPVDAVLPPETSPAVEEATPADPLTLLTQEVDRWKDLAYRSQAELDNFRKRSVREAQETRAYANADLLRALSRSSTTLTWASKPPVPNRRSP